jgi:putative transposase
MKLEVTLSEFADIFKEIQQQPTKLFEINRFDIREVVGKYLTNMMNAELTHYLDRDVEKVRNSLPLLKELANEYFTQKS